RCICRVAVISDVVVEGTSLGHGCVRRDPYRLRERNRHIAIGPALLVPDEFRLGSRSAWRKQIAKFFRKRHGVIYVNIHYRGVRLVTRKPYPVLRTRALKIKHDEVAGGVNAEKVFLRRTSGVTVVIPP